MKKKWISIIMAIALIAGMTSGCGKKAEDNNNQPSAGENNTPVSYTHLRKILFL